MPASTQRRSTYQTAESQELNAVKQYIAKLVLIRCAYRPLLRNCEGYASSKGCNGMRRKPASLLLENGMAGGSQNGGTGGASERSRRRCTHGVQLNEVEQRYAQLEKLAKCSYEEAEKRLRTDTAKQSEEAVVDEYMNLHRELFQREPSITDESTSSACFAMAAETLRGPEPRPVEARQWRLKGLAIQFYCKYGEAFFDALTAPQSTSIYEDWRLSISIPDEEVKRRIRNMCTCSCLGCHVCGASPSNARCAACKQRYYCSRECQKEDWQGGHKNACPSSTLSSPNTASEQQEHHYQHENGECN